MGSFSEYSGYLGTLETFLCSCIIRTCQVPNWEVILPPLPRFARVLHRLFLYTGNLTVCSLLVWAVWTARIT